MEISVTTDRTRPPFSLVVTRSRGTVVVTAEGELDVDGSEQLRVVLEDLMDNQGNLAVDVDLTNITRTVPAATQVLVDVANRAAQRGAQLTVTGPVPAH